MLTLTSKVCKYIADSEQEAMTFVQDFKANQLKEGYIVGQNGYKMKQKKDRKTGEITEEWAIITVEEKYV